MCSNNTSALNFSQSESLNQFEEKIILMFKTIKMN